jgi:hypothetical protein
LYTNLLLTLLLIAWQSSYMNLCYSGMLEQLSLLRSEHCHLLVAVTAFLCKLVSECLLISYNPPEATLKLELRRVQNARSFPNELDCNQWCDFFHSSWNLPLYFFFFDVEEGVVGPEFHLLFVDWDIVIKCQKQILVKAKSE